MNKKEIVERLREWGNGDFSRVCPDTGLCNNCASLDYILACNLKRYLFETHVQITSYPLGYYEYKKEKLLGTLWRNPKRLQLCLDFADWLEKKE